MCCNKHTFDQVAWWEALSRTLQNHSLPGTFQVFAEPRQEFQDVYCGTAACVIGSPLVGVTGCRRCGAVCSLLWLLLLVCLYAVCRKGGAHG
jgi:hypothetical protein